MRGRLIAEEGVARGLVLSFDKGEEWLIGRDPDQVALVIADPLVSRRHARVVMTPEGPVIENLSATNPLLYNDEELAEPKVLAEGALLKIGDSWFRYSAEEARECEEEAEPYDTLFGKVEGPVEGAKVDLTQTGRWLLKVIGGPNTGAELNLQPDRAYLLGTDAATCDIVFHDLSVSRQHARIVVGADEELMIEDLHSRNGVVVGGGVVEGSQMLKGNQVVSLGTTSFVVIDREGVQETLISALPPPPTEEAPPVEREVVGEEVVAKRRPILSGGAFILLLIALALVVTATAGSLALFKTRKVERVPRDYQQEIERAIGKLPAIHYSFNPATGVLFIEGNVLAATEKQQLMSNLRAL
ncbi:MAG: FHA domain-containing protein, partial [Candidatus Obscuribacterales bacterium]